MNPYEDLDRIAAKGAAAERERITELLQAEIDTIEEDSPMAAHELRAAIALILRDVTGDPMTAAEDAALAEAVSLIAEGDRLRQQIEDLRAFEREYGARLLAFHEDRARALREGQL